MNDHREELKSAVILASSSAPNVFRGIDNSIPVAVEGTDKTVGVVIESDGKKYTIVLTAEECDVPDCDVVIKFDPVVENPAFYHAHLILRELDKILEKKDDS